MILVINYTVSLGIISLFIFRFFLLFANRFFPQSNSLRKRSIFPLIFLLIFQNEILGFVTGIDFQSRIFRVQILMPHLQLTFPDWIGFYRGVHISVRFFVHQMIPLGFDEIQEIFVGFFLHILRVVIGTFLSRFLAVMLFFEKCFYGFLRFEFFVVKYNILALVSSFRFEIEIIFSFIKWPLEICASSHVVLFL